MSSPSPARKITAIRQPGQVLRRRLHAAVARRPWWRCRSHVPQRSPDERTRKADLRRVPPPLARRSRRLLGRAGGAHRLAAAVRRRVCDTSRPPFARWFVGGTTNLCHNAVDRHLAARADAAGADLRLDRDRQRARLQLRRAARGGPAHGRGAARARRGQGRSRAALHADDPRGGVRDAGLRADRRDPLGRVRRLRQRQPGEPDRRRRAEGRRQRRRRQPRRQGHRLQAAARRGDRARAAQAGEASCWSTAAWRRWR